jgi:RsiW-degrading membrane proteinase PrsW (M82 family)
MTLESTKWLTESICSNSTRQRRLSYLTIVLMFPVSIGISYFFDFLYKRSDSHQEDLLLNACIYATGFCLVISPVMWYLRTYNFWSIILIFGECFGLILILVTFKRHLTDKYEEIAPEDSTALSAFIAYVSAATFEECLKLIVFVTPLVFYKRFRTVYDAIWFGCLSGVSFATIENLILSNRSVTVALQRFMWCTATHTSDCLVGVIFFLYMKSAEHALVPDKWFLYPFIFIAPVALHGTFDFVIFYGRISEEPWVSQMSLLVGAVSLVLCLGMFYPLRRRKPSYPVIDEHSGCAPEEPVHV